MKTEPNDSATGFGYASHSSSYSKDGLTKREYFAAMAMQGILSGKLQTNSVFVADYSVKYADALIKSLNKNIY
jgi:hypothetical protein